MLELLPKQIQLLTAEADVILFGGARGGAKTLGTSAAAALEVVEQFTENEARMRHLDRKGFRVKQDEETKQLIYFRYLIDYSYYNGVIVRRSLPQLRANSLVETRKIYPHFGARFEKQEYCWIFPSGAKIYLRPLYDERTLDFFQGPSFQRFIVEELTQFDQDMIERAESCCRSAAPIGGGVRIPAKMIYTTNPGGRGHKWVKEKFVDKCPPVPDGDPIYIEEFDLAYQPLKANKPYIDENGERFLFIPSLVFDNPHIADHDKRYVRNLMNKNTILRNMWLLGRWDSFTGQFFDMWDEQIHVIDEYEFYGIDNPYDLAEARKRYDWKDKGYRLYMSNDYGFAEKSAWACGMYAVDKDMQIIKFAEIVESGLSIVQQAKMTKDFLVKYYGLTIDDFDLIIADPKSYWESRDRGTEFYTFADEYAKEGIYLTKGKNERIQGAAAMIEALRLQDNGLPNLRFLSCCENAKSSIPNLASDPKNPNDVDTKCFDHCYDENRYFLMIVIGSPIKKELDNTKKGWRDSLKDKSTNDSNESGEQMTRAFLTA